MYLFGRLKWLEASREVAIFAAESAKANASQELDNGISRRVGSAWRRKIQLSPGNVGANSVSALDKMGEVELSHPAGPCNTYKWIINNILHNISSNIIIRDHTMNLAVVARQCSTLYSSRPPYSHDDGEIYIIFRMFRLDLDVCITHARVSKQYCVARM